jgi:uncharacterized protein
MRHSGNQRVSSLDIVPPSWRPQPFRQFILKIHSRCDLACDHCYVYTMADQRWSTRPRVMSVETVRQTAMRIAEHVWMHDLNSIDVTLHGGEPLLAGPDRIDHCVSTIRTTLGEGVRIRVGVQTNGMLLNTDYLSLFHELGVRVGVSLDGDRTAQDRHRRRADGKSSYLAVRTALRKLSGKRHRTLFGGLLCTIDLHNDPVVTYQSLLDFSPPGIDFLLPLGNWSNPPPNRSSASPRTPYADWLISVFDRWYRAGSQETHVRMFEEIINVLLGGQSGVEGIGLSPTTMVVVATDGAIEQSDTLSAAYQGAAATGMHVAHDSFDAALRLPGLLSQQLGVRTLGATCRGCSLQRVCGGGHYGHRYRHDNGFDNTSVYCLDLYRLISHIRGTLAADIAALRRAPQ